ncbi:MAG: hypothetical protein ABMA64_08875 [Myxococcota bacterium]
MFPLWLASLARADDCDPNEPIRVALEARLHADPAAGRAALERVTDALGCSPPVEPSTLARFWLLEGALLDDPQAMLDNFAGARRVAPDVWLADLGPALRAKWEAAPAATATGTLLIAPAPGARAVWIDGAPGSGEQVVAAGLHLVQVGDATGDRAKFAAMAWVDPGVSVEVETGLAPLAAPRPDPVPQPDPVVPPPTERPPIERPPTDRAPIGWHPELQVLTGGGVALGEELRNRDAHEPATKVAVPTEVALALRPPGWLLRVEAGAGWLVGGQWLAAGADGRIVMAAHLDLGVTAAIGTDRAYVGLAGRGAWPSRLGGRVVVAAQPVGPLWTELRLGANLPTDRPIEPAGELVVGVSLGR